MELIYFILGILFVQYIMPLLDGFGAWFLSWTETKKAKHGETVALINIKLRQVADEEPLKHSIGFQIPGSVECEEEYEDEI